MVDPAARMYICCAWRTPCDPVLRRTLHSKGEGSRKLYLHVAHVLPPARHQDSVCDHTITASHRNTSCEACIANDHHWHLQSKFRINSFDYFPNRITYYFVFVRTVPSLGTTNWNTLMGRWNFISRCWGHFDINSCRRCQRVFAQAQELIWKLESDNTPLPVTTKHTALGTW